MSVRFPKHAHSSNKSSALGERARHRESIVVLVLEQRVTCFPRAVINILAKRSSYLVELNITHNTR